jgi:hypothetical protein
MERVGKGPQDQLAELGDAIVDGDASTKAPRTFRSRIKYVVESGAFTTTMLLAIMVNSAMLGLADYTKYDAHTGELRTEGSWQNQLIAGTEVYFLAVFTLECLLKIYVMGLCRGANT